MSVLHIGWPKYTLNASHAAPWWVTVSMLTGQTDGRTPDCYITLSTRRVKCGQSKAVARLIFVSEKSVLLLLSPDGASLCSWTPSVSVIHCWLSDDDPVVRPNRICTLMTHRYMYSVSLAPAVWNVVCLIVYFHCSRLDELQQIAAECLRPQPGTDCQKQFVLQHLCRCPESHWRRNCSRDPTPKS